MMPSWPMIGLAILLSYLIGLIPIGYWYGLLRGVDIRKLGSGNVGASNVQRIFGTGSGLLVLLVDVAKGFIAAHYLPGLTPYPGSDFIRVGCGLAAILGYSFTPFLKFKGGKSVAATYGIFLALAPFATVVVFLAFIAVVASTRYISAGSMVSAILFPLLIWLIGESGQYYSILLVSLGIGAVIILRHRTNLTRILNGTEHRFGQRVIPEEGESKK